MVCNTSLCKKLPYQSKIFTRELTCAVLISQDLIKCLSCSKYDQKQIKLTSIKKSRKVEPAKLKAPISITSPDRIKLTLQHTRLKCNQLEAELEIMKMKLQQCSVHVDKDISNDLIDIMSDHNSNVTPFINLFLATTMFSMSSSGVRFHPMIIRYCLSLFSKSPSVYEEIRNNGILNFQVQEH